MPATTLFALAQFGGIASCEDGEVERSGKPDRSAMWQRAKMKLDQIRADFSTFIHTETP